MRRHLKTLLTLTLLAALLLSILPAALMEGAAGSGIVLDFDPEGGYAGDYVLLYNDNPDGKAALSSGFLTKQIEKKVDRLGLREPSAYWHAPFYENDAHGKPDPYIPLSDMILDTRPDPEPGDLRVFLFINEENKTHHRLAFRVLHVGQHCRVWSPMNPAFVPLDLLDSSYPAQVAQEFDAVYPLMTRLFGEPDNLPGDGKIDLAFYDIADFGYIGYFAPNSLYERVILDGKNLKGNQRPIIQVDTFGVMGIRQADKFGNYTQDLRRVLPVIAHEYQHLVAFTRILAAQPDPDYPRVIDMDQVLDVDEKEKDARNKWLWLNEFLSAGATVLAYPEEILDQHLPGWYYVLEPLDTVEAALSGKQEILLSDYNVVMRGQNMFDFYNYPACPCSSPW